MKKSVLAFVFGSALFFASLMTLQTNNQNDAHILAAYATIELLDPETIPLSVIDEEPIPPVTIDLEELEELEVPIITPLEMQLQDEELRNNDDVQCLARNIYFESRGEPVQGRYAVANVTMNRVASQRFPNDVCGVVYQRNRRGCQFSWVCNPQPVRNTAAYEQAVDIAVEVYYNDIDDITEGAQYFHADWMRRYPRWSRVFDKTAQYGQHIFYRQND